MVTAEKVDVRDYLVNDVGVKDGPAVVATIKYIDMILADGEQIEDSDQRLIASTYYDGYLAALATIK